jgi:hypothetical protein
MITNNGLVSASALGQCNSYINRSSGTVYEFGDVDVYCQSVYLIIASSYPTPQQNDPYNYAVSYGGYFAGCTPDLYKQDACDGNFNAVVGGCTLSPC